MRAIQARQRPLLSCFLTKRAAHDEQRYAASRNQRSAAFLRDRFTRAQPHLGQLFTGVRIGGQVFGEHLGLFALRAVAFYRIFIELLDQLAVKIVLFGGRRGRC